MYIKAIKLTPQDNRISATMLLPEAGFYQPLLRFGAEETASDFTAKLYINGVHTRTETVTVNADNDYIELFLDELYLPAGICEVALATGGVACKPELVSFIYLGNLLSIEQRIEAEGVPPELGHSLLLANENNGFVVDTKQNDKLLYEVYVPRSGRYALSFTAAECAYLNLAFATDYGQTFKNYQRGASETTELGTYRSFDAGTLEFVKGKNRFVVENMALTPATGQAKLDAFSLCYVGPLGGISENIPAGNYKDLQGGATEVGGAVQLTEGGAAGYDCLISAPGIYKLTAKAQGAKDSLLTVSESSGNYANLLFKTANTSSEQSAVIELGAGKTVLSCRAEGDIKLENLLLEGPIAIAEAENTLCSQLNSAADAQKVRETLSSNKQTLLFDAEAMTQGFFDANPIYNGMLKQNFQNITEVQNCFIQLVFNNLQAPDVALYNAQNQAITALQNGNLRLVTNTKSFKKPGTLVAALYQGNKMSTLVPAQVTGNETPILLEKVDVSQGAWTLKLFYLDSFEKLTPLAMFTNEAVIYVSTKGDDASGDGSQQKPFKTIERAQQAAQSMAKTATGNVIVSIAKGEYTLTEPLAFTPKDSGLHGKVIYRGAKDGETVISGGTRVTGWEQTDTPQIYRAAAPDIADARTLYVNGYAAQRARSKYIYEGLELYKKAGSPYADDGFTVSAHNFPVITNRPEDVELVWRMLWTQQRTPVEDIIINEDNTYTILMDQPYWDWARTSLSDYTKPTVDFYGTGGEAEQMAKRTFYIENAKELLDEPGEFYFDKGEQVVYYYPFPEEDLQTAETYMGTLETMMTVQGEGKHNKVKNLAFENLSFKYGAWNDVSVTGKRTGQADKIASGSNQLSEVSGGRMVPAQLQFNYAENISVSDCIFTCLGSGAISMVDGVSHAKVEGNVFHDISGTGVIISSWDHGAYMAGEQEKPHHITVTNNVFRRTANEFTDTCGVSLYFADDITITHNDFKDLPYTGITAGWGWQTNEHAPEVGCHRVDIGYNRFQNIMRTSSDGGAVYMLGNMIDTLVHDNYINGATFGNGGIYFDGGSAHAVARDNVVLNVPKWLKKNSWGGRNKAIDNFTNMEKSLDIEGNHPSDLIAISGTTYLESDDISSNAAAFSIYQNAGLSPAYAHLGEGLDLPSWRTDFSTPIIEPWYRFVGENSWVDMGDWKAFYDTEEKPNWYRFQLGHFADCIGSFGAGEWLEYDVYIPKDGSYNLTFKAAKYTPSRDVVLGFYVDGVKLTEQQVQNFVDEEYVVGEHDCGSFALTGGMHRVRLVCEKGPMVVGPFKFDDGILRTQNDARFDEGVINPS